MSLNVYNIFNKIKCLKLFLQQKWVSHELQQLFQPENIRNNLRWIAKRVHVAGTPQQLELMDKLENEVKKKIFIKEFIFFCFIKNLYLFFSTKSSDSK